MERSVPVVPDVELACRECGKVCKSKGGLVNYRRRMQEESKEKKTYECEACKGKYKKVSDLKNHAYYA